MLGHEPLVRAVAFLGVFIVLALLELRAPRRTLLLGRLTRWRVNLGLVLLNSLVVRGLFPLAAVGVAQLASQRGWGLLPFLGLSTSAELILAWIALDFAIWSQHLLAHRVPLLWRLHRVHHSDVDYDLTTAVRFHPLEMVFSMLYKMVCIVLLGPSPEAVLLFELSLSLFPLFNHANIHLSARVDRLLRWGVVTPDMHRVHHSSREEEMHHNFGFNVPWWDYLFGTYREQPADSHERMSIGLPDVEVERAASFKEMCLLPFRDQSFER